MAFRAGPTGGFCTVFTVYFIFIRILAKCAFLLDKYPFIHVYKKP